MAKSRKKARKPAAKRSAKKTRRVTVKRKGRKVSKPKAKSKSKRGKAKRAKASKQGAISSAVQTVTDAIRDMGGLRGRLSGPNTFED
jgi:hypothetical protein